MEQIAPRQDTSPNKKKRSLKIANGIQSQIPRTPEKNSNRQGYISDENDELFTEEAHKERLSNQKGQGSKQDFLRGIDIQPRKAVREKNLTSSPSIQRQLNRDSLDGRESPDEIQGAATVQPVPVVLPVSQKRDASSKHDVEAAETTAPPKSSSDIQPTVFLPHDQKGNRSRNKRKGKHQRLFDAYSVRLGSIHLPFSDEQVVEVRVDTTNGKLEIAASNSDGLCLHEVLFKRIVQVLRGDDPCCKVRLNLSAQAESLFGQVDMELSSKEQKNDMCHLLEGHGIRFQSKTKYVLFPTPGQCLGHGNLCMVSDWMDNTFKNAKRDVARHSLKPKRASSEGIEEAAAPKTRPTKRKRITDSLQTGNESNADSSNKADRDSGNPSTSANGPNEDSDHGESFDHTAHGHPPTVAVEIPVQRLSAKASSQGRQTRSTSRPEPLPTVVCDDDDDVDEDDDGDEQAPQPTPGEKPERWQKPLVYPRFGKKKAEVDAQDRERLRDNEFLNDNLVGFYIRFLEDHLDRTNKEAAKRVYFFNSYFYDTLTNTTKNKKPINYDNVQKWTRNVDIFSYDYVVVPINEAAHWYVAIICNLPNLQELSKNEQEPERPLLGDGQNKPAQSETEVQAVPETSVSNQEVVPAQEEAGDQKSSAETAKEETARNSMAAMTLQDEPGRHETTQGNPGSDEEWPEKEENPKESPARFSSPPTTRAAHLRGSKEVKASPRKTKKQRKSMRSQAPRDPQQTTIITMDSLDQARSPTIRNLRLYLSEEAKSKKGLDIDTTLIAAQRARSIPKQSNYSDCGLYLLAYVEKFVRDPDLFISRLLRNEMREKDDWPPLTSGDLRLRLRAFLDDLHDEQHELSREKASEGHTMADQQPISFLLGSDPEPEPEPPADPDEANPEETNPATDNTAQVSEKTSEVVPQEPSTTDPEEPQEASLEVISHETHPEAEPKAPVKAPSISLSQSSDGSHSPKQKDSRENKVLRTLRRALKRTSHQADQRPDGEAILVPDSQEQGTGVSGASSPKESDNVVVEARGNQDAAAQPVVIDDGDVDDDPTVEVTDVTNPPSPLKSGEVEVQVKETPPPENSESKADDD